MKTNRRIIITVLFIGVCVLTFNYAMAKSSYMVIDKEVTIKDVNYSYPFEYQNYVRGDIGDLSFLELNPEDDLTHFTVFKSGEDGYHTYRIPSIVQAKNGTLVAFAEGRRDRSTDPGGGHIDLVYKLSHDGGRSWSSMLIMEKSKEQWGASNPTVILQNSGRILILYNVWKPGRGQNAGNCRPGKFDNQIWLRYSDDNGNTWSKVKNITRQARDFKRWGHATLGPGHGIQTSKGRLVVPVNEPGIIDTSKVRSISFVIFSDDGGNNWKRGQNINVPTNENQIVELDDGRIMIDARQSTSSETRWQALSNDQGQTWDKARPGQVCAPICAGIIRYPRQGKSSLLLWSGIKGPGRSNLILRLSSDQGQSFPVELLIGLGPTAYSDITLLDKGDIGILWEGGIEGRYEKIIFTRIPHKIIKDLEQLSTGDRRTY